MSISHAINAARSGLQVSGLRADIVATNVANASTPGYVRRSALLTEALAGGETSGVRSSGISRSDSALVTAERRSLTSDLAQADLLASTWQTLSSRVGDTADGQGIFSMLSGLQTALTSAAATPESRTHATAVLDSARTLMTELRTLSSYATSQRAEADGEIAAGVEVVNRALKDIQRLNTQIASADRSSPQAAALFDERGRALDTISQYLSIDAVPRDGGTVDVVTKEGVYLLAGSAREIEFSSSSAFGPNQTLADGDFSGLTVDGVDLTPGVASYGAVSTGLFGALFTLRDTDLPNFSAQLDAVAQDLVDRFSDDSVDPTKTPGDYGLFVDTDPAGGAGLAGRLSLNALVDPAQGGELWRLRDGLGAAAEGPPGNSSILTALSGALENTRSVSATGIQGSFSATQLVAHFASITGQRRISNESVLSSASAQHAMISAAEQAKTGVDVDSEMQELLLIEQAYAANARVIEVANQMLLRLMEL